MCTHQRIVGALHIGVGCFVAALVLMLWICAAGIAPLFDGSDIPALVRWVGRPLAIVLLTVSAVEVAAAAAWLCQRPWARPTLAALACLEMAMFPIGSALAAYTFWVLARTVTLPPKNIVLG